MTKKYAVHYDIPFLVSKEAMNNHGISWFLVKQIKQNLLK